MDKPQKDPSPLSLTGVYIQQVSHTWSVGVHKSYKNTKLSLWKGGLPGSKRIIFHCILTALCFLIDPLQQQKWLV